MKRWLTLRLDIAYALIDLNADIIAFLRQRERNLQVTVARLVAMRQRLA